MLIEIDVKTSLYLLAVGNIVCSILLLSYFSSNSEKPSPLKWFIAGRLFQSVAWLLLCFRYDIPDLYSIYVGNSLLFCGFALEVVGFLSITSRSPSYRASLLFVVLGGIALFIAFDHTMGLRIAVASGVTSLIYLIAIIGLLSLERKTPLHGVLISIFAVISSINAIRAYSGYDPNIGITLFSADSQINALTFLSMYALIFASGFGQLLLLKQQDDRLLLKAASTDPLTSIYNRRAFSEHSSRLLDIAIRNRSPVSFLMLDLDFFKTVNDRFGHNHGDQVLISFTKTVRQIIRHDDVFARFGGEEFCIMMNCSEERAKEVAERIRLTLESESSKTPEKRVSTVSIGISSGIPKDRSCCEEMLLLADKNLYKAKESGRNCVVVS